MYRHGLVVISDVTVMLPTLSIRFASSTRLSCSSLAIDSIDTVTHLVATHLPQFHISNLYQLEKNQAQ